MFNLIAANQRTAADVLLTALWDSEIELPDVHSGHLRRPVQNGRLKNWGTLDLHLKEMKLFLVQE